MESTSAFPISYFVLELFTYKLRETFKSGFETQLINIDNKVIRGEKISCVFLYTVEDLQIQKNVNLNFSKLKSLSNYFFQLINVSADKWHICV